MVYTNIVPPKNIVKRDKYREYKNNTPKELLIKGRETFLALYREFFKEIKNELIKRDAGVFIEDFGYFFIWKMPRKMVYKYFTKEEGLVEDYNHHSDNFKYSLQFYPCKKNFKYWSMDNSFRKDLKKEVSIQIKNGKKYKMYLDAFISRLNK